jgi:hypothetical protein
MVECFVTERVRLTPTSYPVEVIRGWRYTSLDMAIQYVDPFQRATSGFHTLANCGYCVRGVVDLTDLVDCEGIQPIEIREYTGEG